MGSGVSSLPAQIDKETFRHLVGGSVNDAVFDANSIAGIMTRDRLIELSNQRDAMLSHEWGFDDAGRDVGQIVRSVNMYLKSKGVVTHFDENEANERDGNSQDLGLIGRITEGVDTAKCVVCFITKNYMQRVYGPDSADKCNLEFKYTLKRKHPNLIIPVILEKCLLPDNSAAQRNLELWVGNVEQAIGGAPFIDLTPEACNKEFELKCEELYYKIVKLSRANKAEKEAQIKEAMQLSQGQSMLSQVNKSREEQQFFQWMARATTITESRRLVYCTSLVKAGVSTVFQLANMMKTVPSFLTSVGMNEYDADQIACAIRDLGLGYMPVRDFDDSLTLESVMFALTKANQSRDDSNLAASALNCVARVAGSNRIMPTLLNEAGICEIILKLIRFHLGDPNTILYAVKSIHLMSINNPDISFKFGELGVCDSLQRCMKCHLENEAVSSASCQAVATLSMLHKTNRAKFCAAGACETIIRVLKYHANNPSAVEMSCFASIHLSTQNNENVAKLLAAGCCLASANALQIHMDNPASVEMVMAFMSIVAADPNSRATYGSDTPCCSAMVECVKRLIEYPNVVQQGCYAMATIMNGNAFNRGEYAKAGACQLVAAIMQKYALSNHEVAHAGCRASFALVAGAPQHKELFASTKPVFMGLLQDPSVPDAVRNEASEALRYL